MERPKLRNVERIPLVRDDQPHVVLSDPMGVAESVAIDLDFTPVLDALDGTRTLAQVRQSLLMGQALDVPLAELEVFVRDLDTAGFLEGDTFRARWSTIFDAFMAAPVRPPRLAGTLVPDTFGSLDAHLSQALGRVVATDADTRALLIPHGPPTLVSSTLRSALRHLPDPDSVDAVVMLGTDHQPGLLPYAVFDRPYATPLGTATHATSLQRALSRRLPWIEREMIRHRVAHSLEWTTLYLQHAWADRMPPLLPILCGASVLAKDDTLHAGVAELVCALEACVEGRSILWIAAAELTHAGEAYGRLAPDAATLEAIAAHDRSMLRAFANGRARDLADRGRDIARQGRPSGLPVLITLAELATDWVGEVLDYQLAPLGESSAGWAGLGTVRFVNRDRASKAPAPHKPCDAIDPE